MSSLQRDLSHVINANSGENESNTPDHVLAEAVRGFLDVLNTAIQDREDYYGVHHETAVYRDKGEYDFGDAVTAEQAVFRALGAASAVAMKQNPQWDFSQASEEFVQIGNALCSRLCLPKAEPSGNVPG